jgi:DNA primase
MIPAHQVERIQSLPIEDVIGRYVKLKTAGPRLEGLCPLHGEKTPSFTVTPARGIFKCFGCGQAGDAISFVMQHEKLSFLEAVRRIGHDHNIEIEEKALSPEEKAAELHRESLRVANQICHKYFVEQLQNAPAALEYVRGRWSEDSIAAFGLGYAPEGFDNLKNWAASQGLKTDILIEAGLLKEKDGRVYDAFRNRIMIPLFDTHGRATGFTGRDLSGQQKAKYQNSSENEVFHKGEQLFGLAQARRAIREKKYVHLVEGNADVIKLHEIGKLNTVGIGGTALTKDQVARLKTITPSVTILADGDKAGRLAVARWAELLLVSGMFVNVIELPFEDGKKTDPDSFFTSGDQFDEYAKANLRDFLLWYVETRKDKAKNPDAQAGLIDEVCCWMSFLPEGSHEVYIDKLAKLIKPKKAWTDSLKAYKTEHEPEKEEKGFQIPKHVSLSDFEKYGFYEEDHCYYFNGKNGVNSGSNFTMRPLYHIESLVNAKRLFEITNKYGYRRIIELPQRDLNGISQFRLRVESLGNFVFHAGEAELMRLKTYLYEKTLTAKEVVQLGWQEDGFWAWSNGIFNGQYRTTDEHGIIDFHNEHYYIPSNSAQFESEKELFVAEKVFRFQPGTVSWPDYAQRFFDVFGDNALIGLSFLFATCFRDHVNAIHGFFPILNIFGPKGAGKSFMAKSLLEFFGHHEFGPNLMNVSRPALADHVGMFRNACCHIEEYRNDIEIEKGELLKGFWNSTGRSRMNMDKDKKRETSRVDCGVILTGQQMPTIDIALFTRLVFLSFYKVKFSEEETQRFNELKAIEKQGLTHLTHEILLQRDYFVNNFREEFSRTADEMKLLLGSRTIEARIFNNWTVVMSSYRLIAPRLNLPFDMDYYMSAAVELMAMQNAETKKSNEISVFWSMVEFLTNEGTICEEVDFKIDYVRELNTDKVNAVWAEPRTVIYINHSRLFQHYKILGRKSGESILPIRTLENYLMNCPDYLGRKGAVAFKVQDNGRIVADQETPTEGIKQIRKITTAMVFDYKSLGVDLVTTSSKVPDPF